MTKYGRPKKQPKSGIKNLTAKGKNSKKVRLFFSFIFFIVGAGCVCVWGGIVFKYM